MRRATIAILVLALASSAGLAALGVWQVERRAWKLDLIERVDTRAHGAPSALPQRWDGLDARDYEYRRVQVAGRLLHDREALVQAVTELGGGFWVMTPLETADGRVVIVNRGFVPQADRDAADRPAAMGTVEITGLMRPSEPGGGFLRSNDPAADRWFSRDVTAIAASRDLPRPAPFFIDAEAGANGAADGAALPVGGLTRLSFPNNHLVYALTWFVLSAMVLGAGGALAWSELRPRAVARHAA